MTLLREELFKNPMWVVDYQATLEANPELAQAMLETGMTSDVAGQVQAAEVAYSDTAPFDPNKLVVTY